MKKVTKEQMIVLLRNKKLTYRELSALTGYHPKSLVRINTQLKNNNYKIYSKKSDIINDYLNGNFTTVISFYRTYKDKYTIGYSRLCKILKNAKIDKEIVVIRKIRKQNDTRFEVANYKTGQLLFNFNSMRNDTKSIKQILLQLFDNYGIPNNICFTNFKTSSRINLILKKYNINVIDNNRTISNVFKYIKEYKDVKYKTNIINLSDFYHVLKRKTISNNIIQFNNTRYKILSDIIIPKHSNVLLYYNDDKDMFILYNKKRYKVITILTLTSKKGLTKY